MIWIILWLGKYRILSNLDSLSHNPHVFLAEHVKLQEYRVIKKISKANPFFKQLQGEAGFLSEYSSEFTPKLYDVEEDAENLYLVEEFVEGENLSSDKFLSTEISEMEVLNIVYELFKFLEFLNALPEKVLYIDWKPGNIMVKNSRIKVVDFGSVIFLERKHEVAGLATEGFAAPELKNSGELGLYTDIYGFGSIVGFLAKRLKERRTFLGHSIREKLLKLSGKCTKTDVSERLTLKDISGLLKKTSRKSFSNAQKKEKTDKLTNNKAKLVGVCGNERGVGTTHISYLIAKNLAKQGGRVAYITSDSATEGLDYQCISSKKGIDFYRNISKEEIAYLLNKDYDNIIVDFGKIEEEFPLLFFSCDEKNIVVQNNLIKGGRIENFLKFHREVINNKGWKILVNLSNDAAFNGVKCILKKEKINIECVEIGAERA